VYGETAAHKNEQASRPKVTYNSEINWFETSSTVQLESEIRMQMGPALQAVLKQYKNLKWW
jgi:hypothetical protein